MPRTTNANCVINVNIYIIKYIIFIPSTLTLYVNTDGADGAIPVML